MELMGNEHTTIAVTPDVGRIRESLTEHGAVLLRGGSADVDEFERFVRNVGGEPLKYTERSTPRTSVTDAVYTSTEYPAEVSIPMHNEASYSETWPGVLFFLSVTAAETGGATPIADSAAVYRLLPELVREHFEGGVVYTRSFRSDIGLSWQEAFQTEDPTDVEVYCKKHNQEFEWTADGLRTRHHRPAYQDYRGQRVWFNQANLFHASSLSPDIYETLMEVYGEDGLPRNAYLGDGSPIPAEDLEAIKTAYDEASFAFPWEPGDILVVDNMRCAHGRQPFTGKRRTLVSMTAGLI
ncbi:TauD/TfdA family dioxygenase [Nonomuraea sp. 10N515B]|uniref:TauD/TfdA family dioxygenase n=1 Tax=Nonomuraea sp. 10N515B TaxID=3457422 RepID=UPI003FCD6BC4